VSGNYHIEQIGKIIAIRFASPALVRDIIAVADEAAQFDKNTLRLWDFRKGLNLSSSDVVQIADRAKNISFPPSKIAILVSDKLAYGLARMYDVYRAQQNQEVRLFETEEEAIKWLKE